MQVGYWHIKKEVYYPLAAAKRHPLQTGIRFEPELLYKISHIAKINKRSLNAQLEFLAQECVQRFESEKGQIVVNDDAIYKK